MKKWLLKIDIKNEIQNLKKLCENFPEEYVFQGETEQLYMDLVKNLETRFCQYEDKIKDITDDDGTWESIENEIGDLMIANDIENSNYCLENIYQYCDAAGIWLIQL